MKKMLGISIAAATALTTCAMAVEVGPGAIEGDARFLYISQDPGNGADTKSGMGIGLNPAYKQSIGDTMGFGVGFGFSTPLSESEDGDYASIAFTENDKDGKTTSFFSLNQLYFNYSANGLTALAGRFHLDTPLAASDAGWRLNDDALQGAAVLYNLDMLTFAVGYVNAFSGIDSAGVDDEGASTKGEFVSMSDAALGSTYVNENVSDSGVALVSAMFNNEDAGINANLWYYMLGSTDVETSGTTVSGALNATYFDVNYGIGGLGLAAQYIDLTFTDDFDGLSYTVTGVKADYTIDTLGIVLAYNSVSGDGTVLDAWGAYPEYAAGNEIFVQGLNTAGEGATSMKLGLSYGLGADLANTEIAFNYISQTDVKADAGEDAVNNYTELAISTEPVENLYAQLVYTDGDGDTPLFDSQTLFRINYAY